MEIAPALAGDPARCEAILRSLPEWFGIEDAIRMYRKEIEQRDTLVARVNDEAIGFLTTKLHSDFAAEIFVMAVEREYHRRGVGRKLVERAEQQLCDAGVEYLQVKTLGPSRPNDDYERTRRFYASLGFRPLEEIHDLWENNPCLLMVKRIGR